jgi:hypothetical protein
MSEQLEEQLGDRLTEEAVVAPAVGVRVRNFRGRILLARIDQVAQLEEVGSFIWRQLDGVRTVGQVGDVVAQEYDVAPGEARADALELLADLAGLGLVAQVG